MTNNDTITTTTANKLSRSEQARVNGAKSKGPKSAAGKCKISQNRMTHGFRSANVTLCNEDREAFDAHLAAYIARYTPADKTEQDLVGHLAYSMWQIMRNNSIEVALFDLELGLVDQHLHGKFKNMDQYGRLAAAIKRSAGDNAFELLRRYKASAERAFHRAYEALEKIRSNRPPIANPVTPVEQEKSAVQTQICLETKVEATKVEPTKPEPKTLEATNVEEPEGHRPTQNPIRLVPATTNSAATPSKPEPKTENAA